MWKLITDSYNIDLNIPDDIACSFNRIWEKDIFDLDAYIKNLSIDNDNSIVVLWSADSRFNLHDSRLIKLNEFYHNIKNPMVIFNGVLNSNKSKFLDFHHQGINLFQHVAKTSQSHDRSIIIEKSKKYLFMSTKDYLSRRYILQHLLNNGFKDQGIIAYKCLQKSFDETFGDNTKYIQDACESINTQIPIVGFDGPLYNYDEVPEYIIDDTYLSILTETYYQGPIFFSEKIYYAMLYNHFFIYLGPPYSLKYLRSIGFKTFGHIINESYDDIQDPAERLFAVTDAVDEFISKPISEIKHLYSENIDIINHNRQLVASIDINETINSALRFAISIR
jgi:hypothetical protein